MNESLFAMDKQRKKMSTLYMREHMPLC